MCDPGTLMLASTAVTMVGKLQSGIYAAGQARYAAQVAEQNKQIAREGAEDAIVQGQKKQRQLGRDIAQRVGSQVARMAANNVDVAYGSAGRTTEDTKLLGREEAEAISENIRRSVRSRQIDAWNYESEKRARKSEAGQAIAATAFGVASTALGGATQYAKFRAGRGK